LGNSASQAFKAYRKFVDEGRGLGHEKQYYETVDQRFLGDADFIEKVVERAPRAEITPGGRKIEFEKLLQAVARAHGCEAKDLLAPGRQREPARPRAQLAYLAREWCTMKAIEIARRLQRDPSMISRLCANYEAVRGLKTEMQIVQIIDQ
jgi:chromosomal replication initiation ATPase DnaA